MSEDKLLAAKELYDFEFSNNAEEFCVTRDLSWDTAKLGSTLRWLRNSRRFSIRGLAILSGVSPSEIHKVECGQQECRIETLLKVGLALGSTPGWILDHSLGSNIGNMQDKILRDADFAALKTRLKIKSSKLAQEVALILACACGTFSILLRSSEPVARAGCVAFPHDEWEKRFTVFAEKIGRSAQSIDRASLIEGLATRPLRELSSHNLLPEIILTQQVARFGTPEGSQGTDFWDPSRIALPSTVQLT